MTVRTILDSKGHHVESIQPGAKLVDAVKLLGEKKIGAVLVLNMAGSIEGILSERDIVHALADNGVRLLGLAVSALMTRRVFTCSPQDGIAGTNSAGTLLQGSLEQSNVEAVSEISNLIEAQRAYEMNSKVISAADQMLQTTAQLLR